MATACRDYGEYILPERAVLTNEETPSIEDMDLRNSNIQFKIFSEPHLQFLPKVLWPRDIQDYFHDLHQQGDSQQFQEVTTGIPEDCVFVLHDEYRPTLDRFSKYDHLSLENRQITLLSFPGPAEDEETRLHERPPNLVILELGNVEPTVIQIDSYDFEAHAHEDEVILLFKTQHQLFYRILYWSSGQPLLSDAIQLFEIHENQDYSRAAIRKIVSRKSGNTISLAWIINTSGLGDHRLYHMALDASNSDATQPKVLTDTASSSLLAMNIHNESVWLHWIDSRFGRGFFTHTNIDKMFSAKLSLEGELQKTLVINKPFDDSDRAYPPNIIWSYEHYEVLAWSESFQSFSRVYEPIQLALLDTKSGTVALAQETLEYNEIISEARRQQTDHLRYYSARGLSPEESKRCDQWINWLSKRREVIPKGMVYDGGSFISASASTVITTSISKDRVKKSSDTFRVLVEPNPEYQVESIMLLYRYNALIDEEAPFEFDVSIPEDHTGDFELSATAQYEGRNTATSYLSIPIE